MRRFATFNVRVLDHQTCVPGECWSDPSRIVTKHDDAGLQVQGFERFQDANDERLAPKIE